MSLIGSINGQYDEQGNWQRNKHCFVYCGERCDCGPPFGTHYSPIHDRRPAAPAETPKPALPERCPWDSWKSERTVA